MKKLLSILMATIMIASLSACGSKPSASFDSIQGSAVVEEMSMETGNFKPSSEPNRNATNKANASPDSIIKDRKIVRNSFIDVETKEFEKTLEYIENRVTELNGYVESQYSTGKSLYSKNDYFEREGQIIARVPAEKSEELISEVGSLYNITSNRTSMEDITDSYYDVEAHLNQMTAQRDKYNELIKKADKLEDIIKLEQALSECQYQIDSLTGQLERMKNRVSYSTITLNIREVVEYTSIVAQPKTFGEKLADSFKRSGRNLKYAFMNILTFVIEDLPTVLIYLAIWAVIIYVVVLVVRKIKKTIKAKKQRKLEEVNKKN